MEALAEAMREEYEAIIAAGFILQLDCPDLDLDCQRAASPARKPADLGAAHRGAQPRRCATSRRADAPAPLLGQLRGTAPSATCRCGRSSARCSRRGRSASRSRAPTPATSTSGTSSSEVTLPDGKVIIPGVLDTTTNYIEHPELVAQRLVRYAELVGRENVIAGADCGFGTFAGHAHGPSRTSSSPSWRRKPRARASPRASSGHEPRRGPTRHPELA